MDRESIQDYLHRAEMKEAQAEALSHILADMATRADVRVHEERVDKRLLTFEERIDNRIRLFDERVDKRFRVFEEMVDKRFRVLEERFAGDLARLKADLTWRIIAIVGFFGTVITILNAFIA